MLIVPIICQSYRKTSISVNYFPVVNSPANPGRDESPGADGNHKIGGKSGIPDHSGQLSNRPVDILIGYVVFSMIFNLA